MLDFNENGFLTFWDMKRGYYMIFPEKNEDQINYYIKSLFRHYKMPPSGNISFEQFFESFNDPLINKQMYSLLTINFQKINRLVSN